MIVKRNKDLLTYLHRRVMNELPTPSLKRRLFRKGESILIQDDQPQHVYFLAHGVVKCFITEENGRHYLLEFLGEGEVLGELELLTGSATLCTVEALTDVETYQVSHDFFRAHVLPDPAFSQLLLQELAQRLIRTSRRASYQQIFPIEYAVLKLLHLFSESQQPVSKQDLADYLAVPVRSLNRVLKHLSEQNLFRYSVNGQLAVSPNKLFELMQAYQ